MTIFTYFEGKVEYFALYLCYLSFEMATQVAGDADFTRNFCRLASRLKIVYFVLQISFYRK